MGISRDSHHKRSATGAKRSSYRNKRKFQLGRQPANTKIGSKRIHLVRVMGGNFKCRAMRLDTGNFAWGSETVARKTRLIDVVYNATNNELVRTKTLVKGSIVQVDATPFRQWWESHYGQLLGKKRAISAAETVQVTASTTEGSKNKSELKRIKSRSNDAHVEPLLEEQFATGRLYAIVKSRPGQSGRCDGYILEGKELEFYAKKIRAKK